MEYITLCEEHNFLLYYIKLRLIKRPHTTLFIWKEKGGGIGVRGSFFLLKFSVAQECSVFSGSSLGLCGFDQQAFSEGEKMAFFPGPCVTEGHRSRKSKGGWMGCSGEEGHCHPAVLRSLALRSLCARPKPVSL